ncbi:Lrp/AsnC family transcriptional regulator [Candidatus Woesearchaeota archaeon]|jgi:Lrp/AsnC family transcriptional regulator, leucine-responsive regulatory protein|nr:Lrp/AsnC family transcriptional regulator [Candidatus Woesearchaeota archaeon]
MVELTETDLNILQVLRKNSRLSVAKIGELVGVSINTVKRSIKKMEDNDVIIHYATKLNHNVLGWDTVAYIFINLNNKELREKKMNHRKFCNLLAKKFPLITHISAVSGNQDIILRLRIQNNDQLNELVDEIREMEGVTSTRTSLAMYDVRRNKLIEADTDEWKKRILKKR